MVEVAASHRKFVGNVCQDHRIGAPGVPCLFLRRNLNHILDSHERLLRQDSNEAPNEDMIANEKRTAGWDFPTKEMLQDLLKGQKPVLRVDSLQIRHPSSKASVKTRSRKQGEDEDGLDWLPSPDTDSSWHCQVSVAVLDTRTSTNNPHRVYVDSRLATISETKQGGLRSRFYVELEEPFLIELEKLFVETDSGSNGYRRWKKTITTKYVLQITIQCRDSEDTAEFLSRLEGRDISSYRNRTGSEGVLKGTWDDLPKCPPEGHLLTLKRAMGHKSLELDYKMEVSMGWSRKQESLLAKSNRALDPTRAPKQQLPTPTASDDMDRLPKKHVISWMYQHGLDTKSTTVEGLFCPLCEDRRQYRSFELLRFHCLVHHDHFKFDEESLTKHDPTTIHKTIWISLGEKQYERSSKEEPTEGLNWVAPSRPFDVKAHLRGEDDWTGQGRAKASAKRGRQPRDKEKDPVPVVVPHPIKKRPAPEEVEYLPQHRRKRHRVPNVLGVHFYRKTSKQRLNPGDYVSESDDDVDESWLVESQDRALADLGITGAARDFTRAFHAYLAREQSDSSLLVREALVRFSRSCSQALQDVDWLREFRAKLNQLRSAGIIGDETVTCCIHALQTKGAAKGQEDGTGKSIQVGAKDDGAQMPNGTSKYANGVMSSQKRVNGEVIDEHERDVGSEVLDPGKSTSPTVSRRSVLVDEKAQDTAAPNGILGAKERKRWVGGKMVSVDSRQSNGDISDGGSVLPTQKTSQQTTTNLINGHVSNNQKGLPIGLCDILVEMRGGIYSMTIHLSQIIKDSVCNPRNGGRRKSAQDVEVSDLDYTKLLARLQYVGILNKTRGRLIWRDKEGRDNPITNAHIWQKAMAQAYQEQCGRDIKFETVCLADVDTGFSPQTNGVATGKADALNSMEQAVKTSEAKLCLCGKSAKDARASLACDNPKCVRKDFHLACVNLERRLLGWRCHDCAS